MVNPADLSPDERRSNLALRAMIDEMLARVREMNNNTDRWTPEERARAEAELEEVMARVRRAAVRQSPTG